VVLQTDLPNVADFTIPKGNEFDTDTTPQIKFLATQDTVVHFGPRDPSTGVATSNPVPVADATAEAAGNVAANTITQWPNNPCGPNGPYHNVCSPSDLTVTNPQPTSGGTDSKQVVVASQGDVDGWQKQIDDLKNTLAAKAKSDMQGRAGSDKLLAVDPGGSGLTLDWDITPLPKPDDQYQDSTITVVAHGKASYYNPADVKKVVTADLVAQVPTGQQLAEHPTISEPKVTQASDDGSVIFAVTGSGYSQPLIDVQKLKGQFAGKSQSEVRRLARENVSQLQDIRISQSIPFFVLPFFSGKIEVTQTFVPEPATR
jgi:hypothetical protein